MRREHVTVGTVVYALDTGADRVDGALPCVVLDTGTWRPIITTIGRPPGLVRRPTHGRGSAQWLMLVGCRATAPDVLLAVASGFHVPDPDDDVTPVECPGDVPPGVGLAAYPARDVVRPWSEQPAYEAAERAVRELHVEGLQAAVRAHEHWRAHLVGLADGLGVDLGDLVLCAGYARVPFTGLVAVLERLHDAEATLARIFADNLAHLDRDTRDARSSRAGG